MIRRFLEVEVEYRLRPYRAALSPFAIMCMLTGSLMACIQVQSRDPSGEISTNARNHGWTQKAGCPSEKNWKAQASGGRDPRRSQSAS